MTCVYSLLMSLIAVGTCLTRPKMYAKIAHIARYKVDLTKHNLVEEKADQTEFYFRWLT
jgi:hypothetical protein